MAHPDIRTIMTLCAAATACLALAACGGGNKTAGNDVEMRDLEVVDGTVNDSMTDLDAVKADGVGAVNNAGNVSRPATRKAEDDGNSADAETVPSE
jgi:hypothetical protein